MGGAHQNCSKSGNLGGLAAALHALARAFRGKSVCFLMPETAQTLAGRRRSRRTVLFCGEVQTKCCVAKMTVGDPKLNNATTRAARTWEFRKK
jgi:hypothetical protein